LSIDPAEQAKIESGIEAAKYYAQGAAKQVTKLQEGLEVSEKATKALAKFAKSIEFIGKYERNQEVTFQIFYLQERLLSFWALQEWHSLSSLLCLRTPLLTNSLNK